MSDTEQKDIGEILAELEKLRRDNFNLSKRLRYLEAGRQSKGKISKWSKVKGALGWPNQTDAMLGGGGGVGGDHGTTTGGVENLKVPQTPSDPSSSFSVSPSGSCLSRVSSSSSPPPQIFSSDSSEDEFHVKGRSASTSETEKRPKDEEARRSKSLDGDASCPIDIHKKSNRMKDIKEHKTPWSKVKDIIHPVRGTRKRSCPDDKWQNEAAYRDQIERDLGLTPKLTVTLPSNEQLAPTEQCCSKKQKRLDFEHGSRSAPSSPIRSCNFTFELSPQESDGASSGGLLDDKDDQVFHNDEELRCEIEASYAKLQARLKDEFTRKIERIVERRKLKAKDPNQPDLSPEFKKKLDEWNKIKTHGRIWEIKERKKYFKYKIRTKEDRPKKGEHQHREEVLIPTSTGLFRFEGISHKFTRRLAEWEKVRGIAPEESTFALLNPSVYRQTASFEERQEKKGSGGITRSKSIGSVADLGSASVVQMVRHPSSRSLNDVEQFQGYSDEFQEDAVLEEVEDLDNDMVKGASCCYEAAGMDEINAVAGPDDDNMYRRQVVDSSYHLLQENISLLDKLKKERDACLQLEDDMNHLEGQIHDVTKSFNHSEMSDENTNYLGYEYETNNYDTGVMDLDEPDDRLYRCMDLTPEYGVKLDDVRSTIFDEDSAAAGATSASTVAFNCPHGYSMTYERHEQISSINNIIAELLDLAGRLELAVEERDREVFHIKNELYQAGCQCSQQRAFSNYTLPIHCLRGRRSQELSRIPKLLYERIIDLKKTINLVATSSNDGISSVPRTLHRCTAQEDLSPSDYRPPSQASSSVSSFSYQQSVHEAAAAAVTCDSSPRTTDWSNYTNNRFSRQSLLFRALRNQGACRAAGGSDSLTDVSEGGSSVSSRTTSNVFVPTTRKIFSTVSQTEAVEVIIKENEDDNEEVDNEEISLVDGEEDREMENTEIRQEVPASNEFHDDSQVVPSLKFRPPLKSLRSQSSSPVVNRKPRQFSSANPLPALEFTTTEPSSYEPQIEPMKLGDELTSSLKQRALKIQRAKEQFLKGERENSLSILVDTLDREPVTLMVKAASTEQMTTVTTVTATQPAVVSTAAAAAVHQVTEFHSRNSSSLMGLLRLRRMTSSSSEKGRAVSALVRQSLVLTPPTTAVACDPSQTKSCPSSPVLNKKTEGNSWIKNPAKIIFRPKGKYTINNK